MIIRWHGHSCFTLETAQGTLVLDPYLPGSVPGLPELHLTADGVLCSHKHHDHCGVSQVELTGKEHTVEVETVPSFHDEVEGAKRGKNTIHVLTAEGLRLAHLGDLGHVLSQEQMEAIGQLDALLIPVGGFYTIDAQTAKTVVDQLKPRVVVPMHYTGDNYGYEVITRVDNYLALVDDVVRYPGNSFELTAHTPAQTAVLTLDI